MAMAAPVYEIIDDFSDVMYELVDDVPTGFSEVSCKLDGYYFEAAASYTHRYLHKKAVRIEALLKLLQDAGQCSHMDDIKALIQDFEFEQMVARVPLSQRARLAELLEEGELAVDAAFGIGLDSCTLDGKVTMTDAAASVSGVVGSSSIDLLADAAPPVATVFVSDMLKEDKQTNKKAKKKGEKAAGLSRAQASTGGA